MRHGRGSCRAQRAGSPRMSSSPCGERLTRSVYEYASAGTYVCSSNGRARSDPLGAEPCTVRQLCTVIVPAGPVGYDGMLDTGGGEIVVGKRADPHVAVVQVEERAVVAARHESDLAHAWLDVFEEDADREEVVVGVRPELDVLVPLHLFPTARRLEVQLRVVELHVGSDEIDHDVDDRGGGRERPVRLVQIGRRAQATETRLRGRVPHVEVEDHVRLGQRATLLDELVGDGAETIQPRLVDQPRHRQPAVLPVVGDLRLCQRQSLLRSKHVNTLRERGPRTRRGDRCRQWHDHRDAPTNGVVTMKAARLEDGTLHIRDVDVPVPGDRRSAGAHQRVRRVPLRSPHRARRLAGRAAHGRRRARGHRRRARARPGRRTIRRRSATA